MQNGHTRNHALVYRHHSLPAARVRYSALASSNRAWRKLKYAISAQSTSEVGSAMHSLTNELKKRHSCHKKAKLGRNARTNPGSTYVLHALRVSIIANESFSIFYFRSLKPRYTFVYKPTQYFHPNKIRDGRVSR